MNAAQCSVMTVWLDILCLRTYSCVCVCIRVYLVCVSIAECFVLLMKNSSRGRSRQKFCSESDFNEASSRCVHA